jgi:hypothetical protein
MFLSRFGAHMKFATVLALLCLASTAFGSDAKETMCVKQKDGTFKCKASGKIEKEPCCETPTNPDPKRTPKPKK